MMGSLGASAGACLCVNPPHHYPGCRQCCRGYSVYYFGSPGGSGVQDGGSVSSQHGPDVEGLLSTLHSLLKGQNVAVNIVIEAGKPLSQGVVWNIHRCCHSPCQAMNHEAAGGFGSSGGGGE